MILKSELNAKNKNYSIIYPSFKIFFLIISWRLEEIRKIERETREVLTMYKMHHPKADTDRLYVKREEGGRGLLQTEATYTCKAEIIIIAEYLNTKYIEDQYKYC
jgi:hypothetical protein